MNHSEIVAKDVNVTVFCRTETSYPTIIVYKVNNQVIPVISEEASVYQIVNLDNGYFKCDLTTPNEDCLLCILFGGYPIYLRVGEPIVRFVYYKIDINLIITYKHYSSNDGSLLASGNMDELGFGFYCYTPNELGLSYIEVDEEPFILKVPYIVIDNGSGGFSADANFLDTGYNTFAFLGNKNSYFDTSVNKWVQNNAVDAKACDLAKAICSRYSLEWVDTNKANWIGNYIKYFRTYNEETMQFMVYVPSVTPESNVNNFNLVVNDELGYTMLRGIQILIKQDITTVPDHGVVVDFK